MFAVFGAVLAGALTTLAPCVLPLLPVIVGGSLTGSSRGREWVRPVVIAGSLGLSVVAFTLLLKGSTLLFDVPQEVWSYLAGGLLILLGLIGLFPDVWDRVIGRLGLQGRANARLQSANEREGLLGAILTGAALGPVFTSCSPLYGYVIVTVLPSSFGRGTLLLSAYVLGLCLTLLAIALIGRKLISRLGWAADAHGWFRRGLGLVFILVGIAIIFQFDKTAQTWIIENSPVAPWNWNPLEGEG